MIHILQFKTITCSPFYGFWYISQNMGGIDYYLLNNGMWKKRCWTGDDLHGYYKTEEEAKLMLKTGTIKKATAISDEIKLIAGKIGQFYMVKHNNDYHQACQAVADLHITDLSIGETGKLVITTARPGMLIGKRGENIDKLTEYLDMPLHIVEAEDYLLDWLLPQHPDADLNWDY